MNQATTKPGGEAARNDSLRGNPKLKALNPEQISKIKHKNSKIQFIVRHKTIYNLTCFPGMSNPPYGGVELPFLKGDLEGFLYEVMRDTIKGKNLPYFCILVFHF